MTFSFEPGDGTTEVILEADEKIPEEFAHEPSCVILQKTLSGDYVGVKPLGVK